MDKRLIGLSSGLDGLIEFQASALGELGPFAKAAAEDAAGRTALFRKLFPKSAGLGSTTASTTAAGLGTTVGGPPRYMPGASSGGIRNYFAGSSFDRPAAASAGAAGSAASAGAAGAPAGGKGLFQRWFGGGGAAGAASADPNAAVATAQKAGQAAGAPWWKNKYAAGAGIAAGAGAGGYYLGSQRQQQMSAWLDDLIQFQRGKYITKNVIDPDPLIGERFKAFLRNVASKQGGKTRKEFRDMLAMGGKHKPQLSGMRVNWKTPKIFESAEEPIEFDDRSRDPEGRFIPSGGGGPDANAMATVYKMPQPGGLGRTVAQGSALAIAGGALGHIGGEIGKGATSKAKDILKRFKKMTPR